MFAAWMAFVLGVTGWLGYRDYMADKLEAPSDVIVTAEGDVLVADPGAHRVYLVEDNQLKAVAGSGDGEVAPEDAPSAALRTGDATEVDLGEPVALAERDGTLFVADRELGAVVRIGTESDDGNRPLQALLGPWRSPQLITAASEGPVYAAVGAATDEPATKVVESAGPNGDVPQPVDPPAAGSIVGLGMSPDDELVMWIEGDGLYVSDERIVAAEGDGEHRPTDIAVGPDGDVAIVEDASAVDEITIYRPDGGVRRRINLPWHPRAVALGPDNEVILLRRSDDDGTFVYRFEPDDAPIPLGPLPDEPADSSPSPNFPPPTPPAPPPHTGFP
jgi:glucose/arabinose dehydrogenase